MITKPGLRLVPLGSCLTAAVIFARCVAAAGLNLSLYTVWKGKSVYKAVAVDKAAFCHHTQGAYM